MEFGHPMRAHPLTVVWFKRDLRVFDHEPLLYASERGAVLPLYIYEPKILSLTETDQRHIQFINDSLSELHAELKLRGAELLVAKGEVVDVLTKLFCEIQFTDLVSHEETGLMETYVRDKAVSKWCQERDIVWKEFSQFGVFRPLRTRDGWAAQWNRRMKRAPEDSPKQIEGLELPQELRHDLDCGIRSAKELSVRAVTSQFTIQKGGRAHGLKELQTFLTERGENYQREMSSPHLAQSSCSRISPYLSFGNLSIREVSHGVDNQLASLSSERAGRRTQYERSLESFRKRLRWHCHFIQKLESEPELEFRNFSRAYDGMRVEDKLKWGEQEHARFQAWCEGKTGYPLIDACMRSVRETGWLTFRMRAMVMSFASYHLWLHWRPTAIFLARVFTDFEPGIHYSQCQMQSGTTGINTIRIYSPTKQVLDNDPEGLFIKRWVPELEDVPVSYIAEPWKMPPLEQRMHSCVIGEDYPEPIVDHKEAYRSAQKRVFSVRGTFSAKQEAKRVYKKHGSRNSPRERRS